MKFSRWLREPTLHFFAVAALALVGHRLVVGDPRTIELTSAQKADLLRRYHDQLGRPPTNAEAQALLARWKADEVLYREALDEGLDRQDPGVRALLVNKMQERLLLKTRLPEPSDAELQNFFEQHRGDYEAPLLYEHEFVVFSKQERKLSEVSEYAAKLAAGATAGSLGLRSTVANVDRERIERDLGAGMAERVASLPPGQWQRLETPERWYLVKLNRIQGGLPEPAVLRAQLEAGWRMAMTQKALDTATEELKRRYRFEEKP